MHVGFIVIALVMGLALLVKGADTFVENAGGLARRMGVSPLVVGLTVVALGTSAPEAAISVMSAFNAADDMTVANVLGSNIVNVLVILGATALVTEVPLRRSTRRVEMPLLVVVTALLLGLGLMDAALGRLEAAALIVLLGAYLAYVVRHARKEDEMPADVSPDKEAPKAMGLVLRSLVGVAAIACGAWLTVEGATQAAGMLGMSDRVVGLTVVALGTSLPELVTSLTAARKGQVDMAVGNAMGSSVLNVLFVLGVAGVIRPLRFSATLLLDAVMALAAVGLLWLLCRRTGKLNRRAGISLLGSYAAYLAYALAT